jgi:hypothetical protein
MDLALHLGGTAGGLSRAMSEREFQDWQVYTADHMLPWRRMELYLAQIAQWVARSTGRSGDLSAFLFEAREDENGAALNDPQAAAAYFGAELHLVKAA